MNDHKSSLPGRIHPALKLAFIPFLLAYEDLIVLLWPGGPLANPAGFVALLAVDIAIGFDVFIRPSDFRAKDEYKTWKVYAFFVLSPLLLGAPWIEGDLLSARYQAPAFLRAIYSIGVAMTIVGGGFLAWGRLTLGRFGTPKIGIQEGHRLITTGPYRFVRHPMYAADLLLYSGYAISFGAWFSAAAAVAALMPMLLGRIKLEDRLLEDRFGDEYRSWSARTKRVLPFVW